MRASPDAIDDASRHGHVAVLDWWRWRSGIDPLELAYSEHALSSATVKRQIDVLEWWLSPRAGGLPLKLPNVLDFASMSGERQILEWWLAKSQDKDLRRSRGVQAKYSRAAMYHLSCRGDTSLLEWWRTDSGLPLKYDKDVLTGATKHGRVHSLEWWRTSGLELEYRFFDVEEAIEDAVVGTDDVAAWWRERGFEQGRITMHDWMKVRPVCFFSLPLTVADKDVLAGPQASLTSMYPHLSCTHTFSLVFSISHQHHLHPCIPLLTLSRYYCYPSLSATHLPPALIATQAQDDGGRRLSSFSSQQCRRQLRHSSRLLQRNFSDASQWPREGAASCRAGRA